MYFVVFFIESGQHAVVPSHWIYDTTGALWNKFVNTGLNSSQTYICYWRWRGYGSTKYFGSPSLRIAANFNANFAPNFPVDEGLYYCRIRHFNVQYRAAQEYCIRRRNGVPPAVVNPRRMAQLPLPDVLVPVHAENPFEIANEEVGNENGNEVLFPFVFVDAEVGIEHEVQLPLPNVVDQVENLVEIADEEVANDQEVIPENEALAPAIIVVAEVGNEHGAIPEIDVDEPALVMIVDAELENENQEPILDSVAEEIENQIEESLPENDEGATSVTRLVTARTIVKSEVAIPLQSLDELNMFCAAANLNHSSETAVENVTSDPAAGTSITGFVQPSVLETIDHIGSADGLRDIETEDSGTAENLQRNELTENGTGIDADNIANEPAAGTSTMNLAQPSISGTVNGDTIDFRDIQAEDPGTATTPQYTIESSAYENHQCNEPTENGAGIDVDNIANEPAAGTSTMNLAQPSISGTVNGGTIDLRNNATANSSTAVIETSVPTGGSNGGAMVTAPTGESHNIVRVVDSYDEDELVMTYFGGKFPVPVQSMGIPEDFIKHENDRISGPMCFKEDNVGRRYIVGDGVVLIPEKTVNTFLLWSTFPFCDQKDKDKFMVQMLLLCCLSATDLEQRSVPQATMIFVEDLLRIRVQSNKERMEKIPRYVTEFFAKRGKQ